MNLEPGILVAILFPLFFVGIWTLVVFLISRFGGWSQLGEHFPDQSPIFRDSKSWQSAKVGSIGYNNCLTIGVSEAGLHLSVLLPFRIFHPNLLIPWDEFNDIRENSFLFMQGVKATIGDPKITTITLPPFVRDAFAEYTQFTAE